MHIFYSTAIDICNTLLEYSDADHVSTKYILEMSKQGLYFENERKKAKEVRTTSNQVSCNIEHIDNLTVFDFFNKYEIGLEPLIVNGFGDYFNYKEWTLDYIRTMCIDAVVPLLRTNASKWVSNKFIRLFLFIFIYTYTLLHY